MTMKIKRINLGREWEGVEIPVGAWNLLNRMGKKTAIQLAKGLDTEDIAEREGITKACAAFRVTLLKKKLEGMYEGVRTVDILYWVWKYELWKMPI
jgi:hypothetical protein